jgi:hypothetical protein
MHLLTTGNRPIKSRLDTQYKWKWTCTKTLWDSRCWDLYMICAYIFTGGRSSVLYTDKRTCTWSLCVHVNVHSDMCEEHECMWAYAWVLTQDAKRTFQQCASSLTNSRCMCKWIDKTEGARRHVQDAHGRVYLNCAQDGGRHVHCTRYMCSRNVHDVCARDKWTSVCDYMWICHVAGYNIKDIDISRHPS